MHYELGRKPSPPDDRDYKMADYVPKLALQIGEPSWWEQLWTIIFGSKRWRDAVTLDQGQTPHCVGFSWAGWGICNPVCDNYTNNDGHKIYYECKIKDGEPGAENGSYIRSGCKVMKDRGRIGTYFFAKSSDPVAEAAEFVLKYGPVVIGIDWYEGMFTPSITGIIKPTGELAGGHAILWRGVDRTYAYLRNSWGSEWGVNGDCKITLNNLKSIWDVYAEACAATELPLA